MRLALLALSAGDGRFFSPKRASKARISAAVIFDMRLPLFTLSPSGGILPTLPPSFFFIGAFMPALRASLMAMALACAGLVTFGPSFEPLCSSPFLNSPMTLEILAAPLAMPPLA